MAIMKLLLFVSLIFSFLFIQTFSALECSIENSSGSLTLCECTKVAEPENAQEIENLDDKLLLPPLLLFAQSKSPTFMESISFQTLNRDVVHKPPIV